EPRRLDHDVGAEILPWQGARVALGKDAHLMTVDGKPVCGRVNLAVESAVDRVVLQQMSKRLGVGEIVDGDDFDLRSAFLGGAQEVAADAAEAVDTDADGHECLLENAGFLLPYQRFSMPPQPAKTI